MENEIIILLLSLESPKRITAMKTWCSSVSHSNCHHSWHDPCHKSIVSMNETAASLSLAASHEHNNYLSQLNYKLVNQINDAETEKYFYRNRLNHEYRNHTSELDQAYQIINQKNNAILYYEETVDRLKKEFRTVEDQYLCSKNNNIADKEFFKKEMENMQNKCRQKIANIESTLEKQYELKLNRRIDEVTRQSEARVALFQDQIQKLTQNSTQLAHELKLMQDTHRDVLVKNDLLIQESINRQLRKRDYEAQNKYMRDVTQYETLLKQKRGLKEDVQAFEAKLKIQKARNNQLQAQLETQKTLYQDLVKTFQHQKNQTKELEKKNYHLSSSYADTAEADTNTEQPFVPVVMPVDLDLISEIVGLKEFVVEKIVELYSNFFQKTAVTDPKKKSLSLTTFKQSFEQLKRSNPEHKILLYIQANLDRVIRLYCPAMNYTREYLTIKDDFIKRTLIQCESIANPTQKLYRILQLVNRLKHPITHSKSEISPGELRLVEIKLLAALKKAIGQ